MKNMFVKLIATNPIGRLGFISACAATLSLLIVRMIYNLCFSQFQSCADSGVSYFSVVKETVANLFPYTFQRSAILTASLFERQQFAGVVISLALFVTVLCFANCAIRRIRDIGLSIWVLCFFAVPWIGLPITILFLAVAPSNQHKREAT